MKSTKKIVSILLALAMVFAMAIPTFAASGTAGDNGKITIKDAVEGQTYTIYRLFDLESYNTDANAYSYKANAAWATWLKTQTDYVSFDANGYVSWIEGADAKAFAKAAQKHADDAKISSVDSKKAEGIKVEFGNLTLGYYLVDSSLGALCYLDTTKPEVTIHEKNGTSPTPDKQVKEDSTGEYGKTNTAQIGDTVEYKTTIHAKPGAQNYVLHDTMSPGLTFNKGSIKVYVGEIADGNLLDESNYTVRYELGHNVVGKPLGGYTCDFEVAFHNDYLDSITENTDIIVYYTAILNENAVVSTSANINKTYLSYGDNNATEWDETKTYTFKFDIVKIDSANKILTGAEFELYSAKTGGEKIALVKESDGLYRVATAADKVEGFSSAVIEAGKVTVKGLDSDTYWLEETQAPDGYNKLAERVEVKIDNANLDATISEDGTTWNAGGVRVVNYTGTELPSTGGIGTTIFYALGFILVVGAAVTLIVRRRMREE